MVLSAPAGLEGIKLLQRMLKEFFHRSRPCELFTDFSYPSAHTARFAFCVSLIFCVLLPKLTERSTERGASRNMWASAAVMSWILMGSTRVLADAHWPSDTVGGACLGVGAAAFIEAAWSQIAPSLDAKRQLSSSLSPASSDLPKPIRSLVPSRPTAPKERPKSRLKKYLKTSGPRPQKIPNPSGAQEAQALEAWRPLKGLMGVQYLMCEHFRTKSSIEARLVAVQEPGFDMLHSINIFKQ